MKKSSVKKIFERCIILNVLYCVLASVFSVLVLRDNLQGSSPLTLIPLIGAFIVFLLCIPEPFLCVDGGGRFMPIAQRIIFYGKILLFVSFEAATIIFQSYWAQYCTTVVLSLALIAFIVAAYWKYLQGSPTLVLVVDYSAESNAYKRTVFGSAVYYAVNTFAIFCGFFYIFFARNTDDGKKERVIPSVA